MIDVKEFPLTYICRKTGKEFKGKTLIQSELVGVVDLETGELEKLSLYKLKQRFKSDPENKKRGQRSKNGRANFLFSTAYNEYLDDENKYDFKTVSYKSS